MDTLADHLDGFIADLYCREFRPNTIRAYTSDLRILGQHLTMPLDQVTLDAIETAFATLTTGVRNGGTSRSKS